MHAFLLNNTDHPLAGDQYCQRADTVLEFEHACGN